MFSLVIPVYNEESAVKKVVMEYYNALTELSHPFEIVVVDDHSTDGSNEILKHLPVKLIRNEENFGYGKSLKTGILAASYDDIIITDADCSYPASLLGAMIAKYKAGGNMVVSARSGEHYKRNFTEKFARFFFRALIELLVLKRVIDVNSGYRIFNRKVIHPFMDQMSNEFSFTTSLTMICAYSSVSLVYVPFVYGKREGKSKVNYLKGSLKTFGRAISLFYYFKLRYPRLASQNMASLHTANKDDIRNN